MAKANIKPLGSHVLVQRSQAADVTKGGIVLPEKGKEKPKEGKIIAVGSGKVLDDGKRVHEAAAQKAGQPQGGPQAGQPDGGAPQGGAAGGKSGEDIKDAEFTVKDDKR